MFSGMPSAMIAIDLKESSLKMVSRQEKPERGLELFNY
jgi:hypothetical protein